jgi:hypothetical protein
MSGANNGPAGPPHSPHSPQQPRWAWWVVGIVIPVVGILVTILMSRPGSSDDKSVESASTPTQSSTPTRSSAPTGSTGQEPATASPTKGADAVHARFGPKPVVADTTNRGSFIDLDSSSPIVSGTDIPGGDVTFGAPSGSVELSVPESATNLAPLPASDAAQTAAECVESLDANATYYAEVKPGDRFCLRTGEGRTAYLRVLAAPVQGAGRLEVTVW